ncbi:MAG: UDP-2,3-diacylglucosamine diphosphatase [Candidatus Thiodiazotropha sp. (ex Lucinoma kastoroae)]|nr:UDP-2,3-diacylglucosamine diphosphatase [Candidatus Thiodiazotropha sp. (ex Lucinoma kastoroae)]MCU7858783.1 UDP-2,3-diacylglucosamine diphosphatase [Candidatus Thiodiazotropha sp. (ex Lucinoma kastoroae)]
MTEQLFISDLHLSADRADTVQLFLQFLNGRATQTDHLYILGDLFDTWVGDDFLAPPIPEIKQAMYQLSQSGTGLWLMHGNRDFLMGVSFCQDTGAELLKDPTLIDLYGMPTLLMHGDLLCTDDQAYLDFRRKIRHPTHVDQFLSQPIKRRIAMAMAYRAKSGEAKSLKPESIMDVNQQAVEAYLLEHGAEHLIHGHTHRPADHTFHIAGKTHCRHVLAEWHRNHAELICVTPDGFSREPVCC